MRAGDVMGAIVGRRLEEMLGHPVRDRARL